MTDSPSDTFCILPWVHLSTRPDGSMRVPCCTANARSFVLLMIKNMAALLEY